MSLTMKQWTTNGVSPQRQFDYWRETICQSFVPLRPERTTGSINATFRGELLAWQAAGIFFARVAGDGQFVYRDPEAITSKDQAVYFLNFQHKGHAEVEQAGQSSNLKPGSFALIDAMQPFRMKVSDDFDQLSIKIPHSLLKPLLAHPSNALARCISDDSLGGRLAIKALAALADEGDSISGEFSRIALEHALQLTALVLDQHHHSPSGHRTKRTLNALRSRAIEIMQSELDDADFSPADVAQQLGVSLRYLQASFTQSNTSIRDWVLEERLGRCRAELVKPSRIDQSIANVAYSHGFNDLSYFNRAFKARYGYAPSKYKTHCVN
jgi:AraC family transcriptional regulator, positive regulator of tynA and feaB